jgi:hypothetical protein
MNSAKIHTVLMAAVLLMGSGLWSRIALQGFEQAVISTATEWFVNAMKVRRSR